jgi:hypothetical protein
MLTAHRIGENAPELWHLTVRLEVERGLDGLDSPRGLAIAEILGGELGVMVPVARGVGRAAIEGAETTRGG